MFRIASNSSPDSRYNAGGIPSTGSLSGLELLAYEPTEQHFYSVSASSLSTPSSMTGATGPGGSTGIGIDSISGPSGGYYLIQYTDGRVVPLTIPDVGVVTGPTGADGIGATGADGEKAYAIVTSPGTVPDVGQVTKINVDNTAFFTPGVSVYIPDIGYLTIVGVDPDPKITRAIITTFGSHATRRGPVVPGSVDLRNDGLATAGAQFVINDKVILTAPGESAYAVVLLDEVVPNVNTTVGVKVSNINLFWDGASVYIPTVGYMSVSDIDSKSQRLILQNTGQVVPGEPISKGSIVTISGKSGRDSYAVTKESVLVPAVSSSVLVRVSNPSLYKTGAYVFLPSIGYLAVDAVDLTDGTLSLLNYGQAQVGEVIPANEKILIAGVKGDDGNSAYATVTSTTATVPAVGAHVTVLVSNASLYWPGINVYIPQVGHLSVIGVNTSTPGSETLTLQNFGKATPGVVIPLDSKVLIGGLPGLDGAAAYALTTQDTVASAVGSSFTLQVNSPGYFTVGTTVHVSGAGLFTVDSIDMTASSLVLLNTRAGIPGAVIPFGTKVMVAGPQGSPGSDAFALTVGDFTVPPKGSTVSVTVTDTQLYGTDSIVFIPPGGYFTVQKVTAATNHLELANYGFSTAGSNIPDGSKVLVSGPGHAGNDGKDGMDGKDGNDAYAITTSLAQSPAIGALVALEVNNAGLFSDGTQVYLPTIGHMVVNSSNVAINQLSLTNFGGALEHTPIPIGTRVLVSGERGEVGPTGMPGLPGVGLLSMTGPVAGKYTLHYSNGLADTVDAPSGINLISITGPFAGQYTLYFNDGSSAAIDAPVGQPGLAGSDGRGVVSITNYGYDMARVTYSDGATQDFALPLSTVSGPPGRGISSIINLTADTARVTFSDGGIQDISLPQGSPGLQGIPGLPGQNSTVPGPPGRGIQSIANVNADTARVTFSDGNIQDLSLPRGAPGQDSTVPGRGIQYIANVNADTARVTFTDGGVQDISLPHGAPGQNSTVPGPPGRGIQSVVNLNADIARVTLTDGAVQDINLPRGAQGIAGPQPPIDWAPNLKVSKIAYYEASAGKFFYGNGVPVFNNMTEAAANGYTSLKSVYYDPNTDQLLALH